METTQIVATPPATSAHCAHVARNGYLRVGEPSDERSQPVPAKA